MEFDIDLILENVKIKLSIAQDNKDEDALLELLLNDAYNYMMIYFDGDIPAELQFIMENVAVKKYRRLGAEGISIEKIDVLSTTYETGDDFAEYIPIMTKYKENKSGLGFRFL
jgi:hypothetical protein